MYVFCLLKILIIHLVMNINTICRFTVSQKHYFFLFLHYSLMDLLLSLWQRRQRLVMVWVKIRNAVNWSSHVSSGSDVHWPAPILPSTVVSCSVYSSAEAFGLHHASDSPSPVSLLNSEIKCRQWYLLDRAQAHTPPGGPDCQLPTIWNSKHSS